MKLTILISKGEEFFIGTIKEIPAVNTQGRSIQEVKENVLDALNLYLEDMREEQTFNEVIYQEDLLFA
jgi:predicted RNase H-like HicB family nuclease